MNTDITGADADALLPHLLEDTAVPITMELQFGVGVSLSFGLGTWSTSAPFKKDCGLNMAGMLVKEQIYSNGPSNTPHSRLGALVCKDSFVGMRIPPVGETWDTEEDGQMAFSAAQVAPTEISRGEAIKNVSLGLMITLSFAFSLIIPFHIWFGIALPKLPSLDWTQAVAPKKPSRPSDDQQRSLASRENVPDVEDPIASTISGFLGIFGLPAGAGKAQDARPTLLEQGADAKPSEPGSASGPRVNSRPDRESSQPYQGRSRADERERRPRVPSVSPDPSETRPMLAHASSRRARGLSELSDGRDQPRRTARDNSWTPTDNSPARARSGERGEVKIGDRQRSMHGEAPHRERHRSGSQSPRRLQSSPQYDPSDAVE
jgi:hypothetical protein